MNPRLKLMAQFAAAALQGSMAAGLKPNPNVAWLHAQDMMDAMPEAQREQLAVDANRWAQNYPEAIDADLQHIINSLERGNERR